MKLYLRIDNVDEDDLIESFMKAAADYIKRMTGKTKVVVNSVEADISTDELYNTCLKMLVSHWYDNRGAEISGSTTQISYSVNAIVVHIATCGDYV